MVKSQQTSSPDNPQGQAKTEDISELSYEEARSQLVEIVTQLEQGSLPLEDSLKLWERGEALAARCQNWLDGARERLEAAQAEAEDQ